MDLQTDQRVNTKYRWAVFNRENLTVAVIELKGESFPQFVFLLCAIRIHGREEKPKDWSNWLKIDRKIAEIRLVS